MHIVVAINGLTRLGVVIADLPGGEASKEIGGEVEAFLTQHILVCRDAISVKYLVCHITKLNLHGVFVVLEGRRLTCKCLSRMTFQRVPACQQWNLCLLTFLEDVVSTLFHKVTIEYHIGHTSWRQDLLERISIHRHRICQTGDTC